MGGTKAGGKAARDANLARDPDFYHKIGRLGGTQTYISGHLAKVGFAANRERARIAGAKGGRKSRRKKRNV